MRENGEKITQNHKFRNLIWSVVFAIGIWLTIVYIYDPSITIRMTNLPMRYEGEMQLRSVKLAVADKPDSAAVSATISGKRSDLMEFMDGVYVSVDVSGVTEEGEYNLPASISLPSAKLTVERTSSDRIDVQIVKLISKTIPIRVVQTGYNKDFIIKSTPGISSAVITGSAKELSNVAYGAVTVDISGIVQDYTEPGMKYLMYDKNNNLITQNDTITGDVTDTTVENLVYKKTTLPIKAVLSSELAQNYILNTSKTLLPTKELEVGVTDEFEGDCVKYIIDRHTDKAEVFSMEDQPGLYVPEDKHPQITPVIEKKALKTMAFTITAMNAPLDMNVTLSPAELTLNLECSEDTQNSDVSAHIDLERYHEPGVYSVPVVFSGECINAPTGVSVEVTISEK
ncbi:MAG: hypothetical protein PUF72_08640 [Clostridiales bacterium]|nr:hypothetical protein [Clostridiales bacterium]